MEWQLRGNNKTLSVMDHIMNQSLISVIIPLDNVEKSMKNWKVEIWKRIEYNG